MEGRTFSVLTDHKPLIFALTSAADRSPRQERHLSYISEFTTNIKHISGADNIVPDTLSRAPVNDSEPLNTAISKIPTIDFVKLSAAQIIDPKVKEFRKQPGSLQRRPFTV